jgi:C-terminal processing protease CtpA/Prc
LRFKGRAFVLISQATASAAMDFAAAIKCFNIATLVGQETRDTPVSYGDSLSFDLPNSGLLLYVPHKYFIGACSKPDGHGVIPDYEVKQKPQDSAKGVDTVLEFTLNLIKSSETKK